ncbi:tenascin-X-like [Ruditapes philippinarum]|uniref:tenascin-X-like n=1 Tax=Ruditapes philippinarum TaxID=129788 RepID=UPI00295A6547|nr:tenascin-X-like [Ruditapes philippinarum]
MESVLLYRTGNLKSFMLKWILLNLFITGCLCQICDQNAETTSPEMLKPFLFPTAVPRGKINAGYYEEDIKAMDQAECLISCCDKPLCNIAWYSMDKCFTIECFEQDESACEPVAQSSAKYNTTLFIQVRPLNITRYTPECSLLKNDCGDHQHCILNSNKVPRCKCTLGYERKSSHSKTCIPAEADDTSSSGITNKKPDLKDCRAGITQCDKHQECVPWDQTSNAGTCKCVRGYAEDMSGNCVLIQDCEFGVTHCANHRECVLQNSRSNSGTCDCVPGYTEDKNGDCVLIGDCEFGVTNCGVNRECVHNGEHSKSGTCQCSSGFIENEDSDCVTDDRDKTTEKSVQPEDVEDASPAPNVTPKIQPTTQKVEMLTVSAGDNKEVQLPKNEVTLTAFALPQAKGEEYHYDWTMEAHPEAEEYGHMDGRNTNTLKLDKLIAGVYTFRIQVTGENKFGEARVNVTVVPRKYLVFVDKCYK